MGNDIPEEPKIEGSDNPAANPKVPESEDSDNTNKSVGTDTLKDSCHTMARSKPGFTPGPLPDPAAVAAKAAADANQAATEAKAKQDEAVQWYKDVLGFPEPAANAMYVEQTLTDTWRY